jgi:hypothetical protein
MTQSSRYGPAGPAAIVFVVGSCRGRNARRGVPTWSRATRRTPSFRAGRRPRRDAGAAGDTDATSARERDMGEWRATIGRHLPDRG